MKRQISDQEDQLISESQSDKEQKQTISVKKVQINTTINNKNNQKQKKYEDLQQLKKPMKKIYKLDDPQLQQPPKDTSYKIDTFHDLPKRIIKQYEQRVTKDYEQNTSHLALSTSQTNKILLYLKQIHLQQQIFLVKKIKQMSEQSKKILDDLTNVQTQIDKYHDHIDSWVGKIRNMENNIQKIRSSESFFQKKAVNMSKLKQYLNVERTRRR